MTNTYLRNDATFGSPDATDITTGTLPVARMPALTGDVTTSAGAVATAITANAVTNAALAQMPATTIKGNATGGTANASDLTVLPTACMPALTGDVTNSAGALATTIAANAVTNAKLAQAAANTIKGNGTGSLANVTDLTTLPTAVMPALTGDVTNSAGALATTIAANAVTNAKAAQMALLTFKGNNTSSTANALDLTAAQLRTAAGLDNTMFRNIVGMAGGFEIWQRGAGNSASIAVAASTTAYTADRWYLTTGVNEAHTVSAVAGLTNGSRLAGAVQRTAGQTGTANIVFGIPLSTDEVIKLRGQNVAISTTISTGANFSPAGGFFTCTLYVGTGAEGKRGGGFTGETVAVGISSSPGAGLAATRFTAVSAGTVPANATQGELQFQWTPVGTAGVADTFTIDDVQIEAVPSANALATAFERWSFEECLNHCRRHYWKSFLYGTAPAQNIAIQTGEVYGIAGKAGAVANLMIPVRFPVPMRAAPGTVTFFNPAAANAQIRDITGGVDMTSTALFVTATAESIAVTGTGNAGTAVGNVIAVHITADAGL